MCIGHGPLQDGGFGDGERNWVEGLDRYCYYILLLLLQITMYDLEGGWTELV
jgi:hypothetical protein